MCLPGCSSQGLNVVCVLSKGLGTELHYPKLNHKAKESGVGGGWVVSSFLTPSLNMMVISGWHSIGVSTDW